MEKILRKGFILMLSFLMVFTVLGQLSINVAATEEYENIALNKSVIVSSATTGNEGAHAVDGKEDTKWEAENITSNPTIIVDLGKEESFQKVTLKWASNFAFHYKLYVAKSDQKYNQILFHEEGTGGDEEWEMNENTVARYVKIELIQAKDGESTIGLKELEVLKVKKNTSNDPVNIALNKPAYASGNEAGLERLGPKGAFDGNITDVNNGRWSSANITKEPQWIYVDLEAEMTFASIHILWENAYATKYVLQYSNDLTADKNWTTFKTVEDGQGSWEKFDFEPITARFVRLYATASNGVGSAKPISIWEMEIYEEVNNSLTVDDVAKDFTVGTITSEMDKMPVYHFDNDNIIAEIFCSDTDFVVEDNGAIHKPLVDKEVLVTYIIKDTRTNVSKEVKNMPVIIPGRNSIALNANEVPTTVPTIQEWNGATGTYHLTSSSRIIVQDESLSKAAQITKDDIKDLFGLDVEISNAVPKKGDIVLTKENADTTIGNQGYTLEIGDIVTIRATEYQGVFFGTRSILQALVASGDALTINKGEARDYAKYEYRKFMLDVARKYMPMWYMKDFVKYASWYKFTDIQVHLNDTSYNGHSRFRLESDIPGLTATDGYYTKDEYRDFQYYAEDYGIRIVSEFDTPAHSAVFIDNNPELGFDATHLDIRLNSDKKDTVYKFIADLYEEYMGGDNPVFVTDAFNVGLDEYNSAYKEDMTQYTKYVMDLVYNKYGKTPMAWASMGCVDSSTTQIPEYPIMDAWANYAISLKSLFNQDYKLINATNKYGYIVPGGNNGYPDFAKEEEMYNNLSAGKFRDKMGAGIDVAEGHPKIVGGSISLWNDRGIFNGISVYDVFARTQSILPIYAQTFWYGKDNDKSYDQFKAEVDTVGVGPNVEMDKKISSKTEKVYDFDMESISKRGDNLVVKDNSGNGYDATAVKAATEITDENQVLKLNGDGYLQMQHSALKWPYTLAFDLKIDESQTGDIILFEENMPEEKCNQWIDTKYQTRKIYLKEVDGKYQLMYDRDSYHYEHDIKLEKGKLYQIAFTSDKKYTKVYLDGVIKSTINGPILTNSGNRWYDSASINLPLQKIGQNLIGTLDNIKVYNRLLNNEEIKGLYDIGIDVIHENIALNKEATASSSYTDYQTPNKAFDGIINQSASGPEQSRWASARNHDQWIQVDLNKVYKVDQIKITWEDAYGVDYELKGSVNGKDWFTIKTVIGNTVKENNLTGLGNVEARYIKLIGTKAANNAKYGYSIYEIEVYENPKNDLLRTIDQVNDKLNELNVGNSHGQIKESAYREFIKYLSNLENEISNKVTISTEELLDYKEELSKEYTNLKKQIVRVDKDNLATQIDMAKAVTQEQLDKVDSAVAVEFKAALENAQNVYDNVSATQEEVDNAFDRLEKAMQMLELCKPDKTALSIAIDMAKEVTQEQLGKLVP
ncbi:MAG: discoidin domain-containing protein, partial [Thomasclavelia sp.]|uniref:discoidin domain-containing protein n=1 Tax=Thomasclavelia sp. TaxID=3025757 RepID=UPI0039A23D71